MTMGEPAKVDPKSSAFFDRAKRWHPEGKRLRRVLLECNLTEELKWGKPCYTAQGKNIAIIQPMKDFLALMFFKGALLKDSKGVLQKQGENTQSALRVQFTSVEQVARLERTVKALVREAIDVEKAGLAVPKRKTLIYVDELVERLARDPVLKKAFEGLTPGRRREYNLYFSAAKQAKTREARVDKVTPKILAGKGFRE